MKRKKSEEIKPLTKEDYYVEKEWHGLYRIPSVDKIRAFEGAFKKKKKFNLAIFSGK
ncbi:MAG: hypothetical protein AB1414_12325 [bacterium]